MILPRSEMTPRIHGSRADTERGSVKRMISWTLAMGSAYSSLPNEKTTTCWEAEALDMPGLVGRPGAGLNAACSLESARRDPPAEDRPDRRGAPAVGGALARRAAVGDVRRHVGDARPAGPARAAQRGAAPVR